MKKNDLISVVIPTYGRSDTLKESINSVLNQTYNNIEIIIVDDNDPKSEYRKETEKIISKFISKDKRVKYIKHEKNKNGAAARNTGIRNSKGDFIAFLDDDDVFFENKLEKQYEYLQKNKKYKCVGCSYVQKNKIYHNKFSGDLSKEILTLDYCFTTSMLFFEKNALIEIGCFDERFIRHQDYELLLKYFKKYEIGYLDEILLEKGINNGENIPTGKKAERNKKTFLKTFNSTIEELDKITPGIKKKIYFKNYFELFKNQFKGKHYILTTKYLFKSFFISPLMFIKEFLNLLKLKGVKK